MAEISAALVKELREKTGAGMMDCKNALAQGKDLEEAIKILREKGLAKASKKDSRVAAEGLVAILVVDQKAAMIEINCETDFVARNADFKSFADECCKVALSYDATKEKDNTNIDALALLPLTLKGQTIEETIKEKIATIGEKIAIRRFAKLSHGALYGQYLHGGGNIGVLVEFGLSDSAGTKNKEICQIARDIAMHIAASAPAFIELKDIPEAFKKSEKDIFVAQVLAEGKPENMVEKIVLGKLNKHLKDMCLMDQPFVKNPDLTISQILDQVNKNTGFLLTINKIVRYKVGEGIEKTKEDFASEVKKMTN